MVAAPVSLNLSITGRTFASFWVFGLVNNVLYVVILSAAIDLVGPEAPKAIVLLADVLPSFIVKLAAPFFIHVIPYHVRIAMLIFLSFLGMLVIALFDSVGIRLLGVMMASLSSGLGEISFLALTHFYNAGAMPGFSSGTGAAGLVGSFVFLLLTSWMSVSTRATLIIFSLVPFAFWAVYAYFLPSPETPISYSAVHQGEDLRDNAVESGSKLDTINAHFQRTIHQLKPLVFAYMAPLMLVYVGEYTINQGISPTLLFPIEDLPFDRYRDVYVTYGTIYQLGVFISRSSSALFRVRKLYVPAALQMLNVLICIIQSLYMVLPNVYVVMLLVFYEGLLGGLAYVNTFLLVLETAPLHEREFSMGAVGVSDSGGIVVAALISLWLEKSLCGYQKNTGRPWCDMD